MVLHYVRVHCQDISYSDLLSFNNRTNEEEKKRRYNFSTFIFSVLLNITLDMVHIYQFKYAAVMGCFCVCNFFH